MYFKNIKHLAMGLLLINSIDFIYASNDMHTMNDVIISNKIVNDVKQNLQTNVINNNTKKVKWKDIMQKEDNNKISHYEENDINNSMVSNKGSVNSNNDEIDNIFEDWDYNEKSKIKNNYKKLSDKLLTRNITQLQNDLQPAMTINVPKIRKLSDASRSSVKSYFSNPLNISHRNGLRRIDEFLNSHEEIIPIIILQSDGLQVLDTIAHLLAFNSFYSLNNFGTNPYIFCASSASIPGLSLALDLQNLGDPTIHLEQIGQNLYKSTKTKNTDSFIKKKCSLCSWNTFKLVWLGLFGCCIDYDEDNIVDSLYTKINKKTANDIITNTLSLDCNSDISIPNLVIKDVNYDSKIIEQVLQANDNQDKKSTRNQMKLFAEPFVSFIKNFVDCKKSVVEKGIKFVEKNINGNDLIKISSKDEKNFIQQKKLNDSTVDRLFLILSSDVDNDSQIQKDTNNIEIEYKEIEYEKMKDDIHAIKITLYTTNSIINQNYSLEEKINNVKSVLNTSAEFKYLISNLPQVSNSSSSIGSNEDLKIQNISIEQ